MKIENLIKDKFGIDVKSAKVIGEGYDSRAYLINNEYIFKIKTSLNAEKGYAKEKAVLDFINDNLKTEIQIPKIEHIFVDDTISIMGYKKLDGKFLNPELYAKMTGIQKSTLKKDIDE